MLDHDEALDRLHQTAPEMTFGLSNHGPMAVEALGALGHRALAQGFLDVYLPRLRPLRPGRPLALAERAAALGDYDRVGDWIATFAAELDAAPWASVVAEHVPCWLDGMFAGAAHGLLRTAHAVRALEADDTPARRLELAHGLGYWAARYQRLPGEPLCGSAWAERGPPADPPLSPAQVLAAVAPVPSARRRSGLFRTAVGALDDDVPFARAVTALRVLPETASHDLHALCVAVAELYLLHPTHKLAYVHALTAPSAVRLFAAHLGATDRCRALAYATQVAAALHAISADADPQHSETEALDPAARAAAARALPIDPMIERMAGDPDEIRYRAACSLDEHAIKFAEACLREHRLEPDPVLCLAAADAAITLSPAIDARC